MKRLLFSLACLLSLAASAQENNFSLSMKVPAGEKATMYYILRANGNHDPLVDSVLVKDGKIEWSTKIDKPVDAVVVSNDQENRSHYRMIILPDEEAVISTGEEGSYYISGSRYYSQSDAADRYAEKVINDISAQAQNATDEQKIKMREQIIDKISEYVRQHSTEEGAIMMANYLTYGILEKLISPEVRNGRLKDYIDSKVAEEKAEQEEEAAEEAKIAAMSGKPAPDFTLTDINGKPFQLSSLRGKYVVLDFWGSWCIWCIRGIPKMKAYYKKYEGKFEIVGVDCNDTDQKWRDAVKKYEIPWLHVYNPKSSSIINDYNVQGYPTKVLIGPDGNIIHTIVGEDPKFYDFLDSTFGK